MNLTSADFANGQLIPAACTCDAENRSPQLAWSEVPVNTRSLVLLVDDPDAPRGTWVHWLLFNLPADAVELSPGVPRVPELPSGGRQGVNDSGGIGYGGPCPPPGAPHRYFFRLYALGSALNLSPGVTRADLEAAMAGHVLADATLMGIYRR